MRNLRKQQLILPVLLEHRRLMRTWTSRDHPQPFIRRLASLQQRQTITPPVKTRYLYLSSASWKVHRVVNRIIPTPIAATGASLGPRMTIYLVRPFLPVIILVNINGPLYRGIRRLTYHFKYSLVKAIRDGTPSVRLSGAFMMFKYLHSFIRDEVEFRWSGNKVFLPGTVNNTVTCKSKALLQEVHHIGKLQTVQDRCSIQRISYWWYGSLLLHEQTESEENRNEESADHGVGALHRQTCRMFSFLSSFYCRVQFFNCDCNSFLLGGTLAAVE